jgi:hypothetical protein
MRGLSLFARTNSPRHWNLASWHSPHSLTWSWILHADVSRPTFNPHWRAYGKHSPDSPLGPAFHAGFGTLARVSAYRNNNGWQLGASLLGVTLSWSRQQPMWYHDLWRRERDRQDQLDGLLYLPDNHPEKVHRLHPAPSPTHPGGSA